MASKIIVDQLEKTTGGLTALTLPSANATASQYLQNNGSGALSWSTVVTGTTGGLAGVMVYTSGATWNKATREAATGVTITKVVVEVQGAGGSGSAATTNYGAGAGGGFSKKLVDVSSVTASTVTVGTGGPATGSSAGAGSAGGFSKWADLVNVDVVGNGGTGHPNTTSASVGGSATGGDIQITGGHGFGGNAGGGTFYGNSSDMNTQVGQGYGSGGGHGYSSYASGAGADGIVIVWEYQ
jgi:hypothetical protein